VALNFLSLNIFEDHENYRPDLIYIECERYGKTKSSALANLTFYFKVTTHKRHQVIGDGQPKSRATKSAGDRIICLRKRFSYFS
jgi:hypothetical protein